MPNTFPTLHADDPVSRLIDRSTRRSGRFPVPLIATSCDVTAAQIGVVKRAAKRYFGSRACHRAAGTRGVGLVYRAILARAKTRDIAHAAERLGLGAQRALISAPSPARDLFDRVRPLPTGGEAKGRHYFTSPIGRGRCEA